MKNNLICSILKVTCQFKITLVGNIRLTVQCQFLCENNSVASKDCKLRANLTAWRHAERPVSDAGNRQTRFSKVVWRLFIDDMEVKKWIFIKL